MQKLLMEVFNLAKPLSVLMEDPLSSRVLAIQRNLAAGLRGRLRNSFLSLSVCNPESLEILRAMNARYYLPATQEDFSMLRKVIAQVKSEAGFR